MSEYIVKCKEFVGISGEMKFPEYIDLNQEIVRCRDCAKADYAEIHMFDGTRQKKWTCTRFGCFHHMVQPDDFCSRGERREP